MKKVAIITNIPAPYRVDMFNFLMRNENGYEFHIIYAAKKSESREWRVAEELPNTSYLKHRKLFRRKKHGAAGDVVLTTGLKKELDRIRPDVIISSEFNLTSQMAISYARRRRIPYVCWSDATKTIEKDISYLQRKLRARVIRNSSAFLASSTKTRELLIEYGADPEKIFISLLTVDTAKYTRRKTSYNNHMVYVGRADKPKGLDLLIKAMAELKNDYVLEILGASSFDEELTALAREYGVLDKIKFHGFVQADEIGEYYAACGLFVFPTRFDCFGLVTLEAMCASLPIVISRYADGAYDLMKDKENGYIVDPYDTAAFAKRLDDLLQSEERRRQMGERSFALSEQFGLAPSAEGFYTAIAYADSKRKG